MKRISNKRRDAIFATINDAVETYNTQRAEIVEQIDALVQELEEIRETYESTVQPALDEIEEICDRQEAYFDDRSERWQDSETGEEYTEWMDAWCDVRNNVPELDELPSALFELEDADTPHTDDFSVYMDDARPTPTGDE